MKNGPAEHFALPGRFLIDQPCFLRLLGFPPLATLGLAQPEGRCPPELFAAVERRASLWGAPFLGASFRGAGFPRPGPPAPRPARWPP